jgi:glutaryl-CoA dehydrogenase
MQASDVQAPQRQTPPDGRSLGTDFYLIDQLITPEERAYRDKVRQFMDNEVVPIIGGYWERAEFPFELIPKMAALGLAGGPIKGYGCPGMSHVASGLCGMELARGDGSIDTFFGVHSGLAMTSIYLCGSEEQRQHWLPKMARMEAIGAFGLTEPFRGSDAAHIQTRAKRVGDGWVLNGAKRWIGNAPFADVTIIWAQNEDLGTVNGFLVERGTPGLEISTITGKTAKRSVLNADIALNDALVPETHRLQAANSFRDVSRVLTATRAGVAWEAVGHAIACYEAALTYAKGREQFGKPIAGYQLVQEKLVRMLADITSMQLLMLRLGQLLESGQMTAPQASLAKMHCAARAREVCLMARDVLGGNGILLDYIVARHVADMEAVYTYEGTNTVQTLVVGREITGMQAFV